MYYFDRVYFRAIVLLPEASFGLRVLSLPASDCVCGNHELVHVITHHPFILGSPNVDQRCKTIWLRSLFYGTFDPDLQGQIGLQSQNLPHFELVLAITHHQEENNYYRSEILSNKNNLRKVWDIIIQVVNRKKGSKIHEKFIHNDKEITDPKAIANGFNNYFVNIGPTLASKIPNSNLSHRRFLPENLDFPLFLEPTNETEIKNIVSLLK